MIDSKKITQYMTELEEDKLFDEINKALDCVDSEVAAKGIIIDCQEGMAKIGELFQNRKYYIGDLICAGELFKDVTEMIKPYIKTNNEVNRGKIVLGTVRGDIHDIGKNIFKILMENEGFEVFDIGIDKSPFQFLNKIREINPIIVGLSGVLMISTEYMRETIELFNKASIRDDFKVIIGGTIASEAVCKYVGADAFMQNFQEGVDICLDWIKREIVHESDEYSRKKIV